MEFPHGHSHHHHHHRRDDEREDDYPPPSNLSSFDNPPPPRPPSFYGVDEPPPPPFPASSHVYHSSHESHDRIPDDLNYSEYPAPPPRPGPQTDPYNYNYPSEVPPPRPVYPPVNTTTSVHHVSHEVDQYETHHGYRPHVPSFSHHKDDHTSSYFFDKPTFKVYCQANPNYSLTNRDGKVILAASNPSDEFQHWYKDEKYSTRVKDEDGFPCFALVNKATGQAIKHAIGASHPVQLIPYNPDGLDQSILWTESRDFGNGFRTIRMVNNIRLNMDAYHGDKNSGGVHDGTTIVLWDWNKGDNQLWKIVRY